MKKLLLAALIAATFVAAKAEAVNVSWSQYDSGSTVNSFNATAWTTWRQTTIGLNGVSSVCVFISTMARPSNSGTNSYFLSIWRGAVGAGGVLIWDSTNPYAGQPFLNLNNVYTPGFSYHTCFASPGQGVFTFYLAGKVFAASQPILVDQAYLLVQEE